MTESVEENRSGEPTSKGYILSLIALLFGVIGIGLASVPNVIYERPLWPIEQQISPKALENKPALKLKLGNVSIGFGESKEAEAEAARIAADKAAMDQKMKRFTLAAIACSILGFILIPFAWTRERRQSFAVTAILLCCIALTWQYFVIGVVVGVGISVLMLALSSIST